MTDSFINRAYLADAMVMGRLTVNRPKTRNCGGGGGEPDGKRLLQQSL